MPTTSRRSARTFLYQLFHPLMAPLDQLAAGRGLVPAGDRRALTVAAMGLAALRIVPLKMLPFDNKNELLLRPRLRRGHDAGASERRGPRDRGRPGEGPRGHRLHQLRRLSEPDRLQRPGAALLPAADAPPRRDPGQPRRQEAPRGAEPRDRAAAPRPPDRVAERARGAAQGRRAAAGTAGARLAGRRDLRPPRPLLRRPDRRGRHGRRPPPRRAGRRRRSTTRSRRPPRSSSS